MLNLVVLGEMGKRLGKRSQPKRDGQRGPRSVVDALVLPPAHATPAQAEHFVQFALQFLH